MFKNAKVHEKVYDKTYGKGEIIEVNTTDTFPIVVEFVSGRIECYTFTGKYWSDDVKPSLYYLDSISREDLLDFIEELSEPSIADPSIAEPVPEPKPGYTLPTPNSKRTFDSYVKTFKNRTHYLKALISVPDNMKALINTPDCLELRYYFEFSARPKYNNCFVIKNTSDKTYRAIEIKDARFLYTLCKEGFVEIVGKNIKNKYVKALV